MERLIAALSVVALLASVALPALILQQHSFENTVDLPAPTKIILSWTYQATVISAAVLFSLAIARKAILKDPASLWLCCLSLMLAVVHLNYSNIALSLPFMHVL